MGHRYFADSPITSTDVILSGSEAHHLLHVMRAGVGDELTLFDGSGREFTARIERLARAHVELSIVATAAVNRESSCSLVVGAALPKGERQHWLVEKLVEVGVARLVPLRTTHSVVHPETRQLQKLRRFVIEASKQCGRNQLMEVAELTRLEDYLAAAPASALRWMADPAGTSTPRLSSNSDGPLSACLAVGPEGGFSRSECILAREAGWHLISWGPRTLRIETACLVMAAQILPEYVARP